MSDDLSHQGGCAETSGFLFKHACAGIAVGKCDQCAKAICNDHSNFSDEKTLCTTCAKNTFRTEKEWRSERRYGGSRYRDDDPYFYSGYHYGGYGYYGAGYWGNSHMQGRRDRNDFTEGDAENLTHEGDDDFEQDMNES